MGLAELGGPRAHAQGFGVAGLLNPEGSRLFPQSLVYPRHPGKPDPRWKAFDWKFADLQAPGTHPARYRLYYYSDEDWTARFAAPLIETQVEDLAREFNYTPSRQFSYLLFTSLGEFAQANVFDVSEGVQGITSTTEATMAIPYWGEASTFEHISKHEMTHQFQVQKISGLAGTDPRNAQNAMAQFPLWFIEGMAEFYSLGGLDHETRFYIRDVLANPDKKRNYEVPKLFDEGTLNFIGVYKLGQARLDYFETAYGKGATQRILDSAAKTFVVQREPFAKIVSVVTGRSLDELEAGWTKYLKDNFSSDALSQSLDTFEEIKDAGDTLDYFRVSPDASLLALRELDPLAGTTRVRVVDLKGEHEKQTLATDHSSSTMSLYFMQNPTLALSAHYVAYAATTTRGPEIELQRYERDSEGELGFKDKFRIKAHEHGLIQISSLALSPDEKELALVGLTPKGWANVYRASLDGTRFERLTNDSYAWRTLSWGADGILGASDRTANKKFGIFHLDPATKAITPLLTSPEDLSAPEGTRARFVFQSWATGSPQIHRFENGRETKLTEAKTGLFHPQLRGDALYALGFRGGRYRAYVVARDKQLAKAASARVNVTTTPWQPVLGTLPQGPAQNYRPFKSSGVRIDDIGAFYGTGGVAGIGGVISDLMRDYSVSGEFAALGSLRYPNASVFLSSSRGRSSWTTGAYTTVQPRFDSVFDPADNVIRTYVHKETGVLGALQYPLSPFTYVDAELRLGGVNRIDYSDPVREGEWQTKNPGREFLAAPMVRLGYDRILYEQFSGPLRGFGLLFENETSIFPRPNSLTHRLRFDGSYYIQAVGRTVIALQVLGGAAIGGDFRNPFYISSDDILRAYSFGDDRLQGNYVAAGKAEIRFPIGTFFGVPPLRGLLAYDQGSVFSHKSAIGRNRTSSASGGLSINLPPLGISFILSAPLRTAPGPTVDGPVFHFMFRYLYL